jgi:pimeloyl-ACP methyl ester carboxylesterase
VAAGAGEPAVVLEAGMNCGAASWQRVMPLLAPHVRAVAYDRAGIGGSAPAPGLAVIDRQVDDLASVITGLAAGPCVLAGHSWGGMLVQLLAFRRPELAAGLVLVDPGHEEIESGLPPALQWGWRVMRAVRGFPLPRRFRAHWTRLQAGLAATAPQGRHVVVDGTGHNIPRNRPDAVAGTILAVAAQARGAR